MKNIVQKYEKLNLLLTVFIVLVIGSILSAYLYFSNYTKGYNTTVTHQLSVISELKVDELEHWRKERLLDAAFFYNNSEFSSHVKKYFSNTNDGNAESNIKLLMSKMYSADEYDAIFLLDKNYTKRIAVSDVQDRTFSYVTQRSIDSIAAGAVVFEDFYYDRQSNKIFLTILVPVFDDYKKRHVIGIIALRIDPERYLYPLLLRWTSDSKSGETLLIRREGNEVVYVNQLRFQNNAALKLRFDLEKNKDFPAAKAVLGNTGIVKGIDYRGIEVTADVRSISNSPWFIITKMDAAEMYSSYRERLLILVILIILIVFGAAAFIGFVLKQNSLKNIRGQLDAAKTLHESEDRFRTIVENIGEGIAFVNPKEQFIFVNNAAEEIFGVASGKLVGKNLNQFVSDAQYKVAQKETTQRVQGNKSVYELEIVRPNGEHRYIIVTAVPRFDNEKGFLGTYGVFRDITVSKKAEESLHYERVLLRTLIDNIPDSIYSKDLAYRKILANVADIRNMGAKSEAEVLGKDDFDFYPKELAEKFFADDQLVIQTGTSVLNKEEYVLDEKGEKRWLLSSKLPLRDKDNEIIGLIGIGRDVTKRKRTEDDLKSIHERYRELVELAVDGILVGSHEGIITEANSCFCTMTGKYREELIGRHISEVLFTAESLKESPLRFDLLQQGETVINERNILRPNGSEITVEMRTKMMPDGTYQTIYRDVTERKKTEETLQNKERYQRALLDNFPFAVWLKDTESRFLAVNQMFAKTFGALNADVLVGKNDFDIASHDDAEGYRADDRAVLKSRQKKVAEEEIVDQGVRKWFETYKAPVIGSNNELLGTVGFTRDISERKRVEKALTESEKFLRETQIIAELGTYTMDITSGKWVSSEILDSIFGIDDDYDKSVEGWGSLIHPEWQKIMTDYFVQEVVGNKTKFDKEYKIIRRNDKSERWVHGVGELKFNDANQPITMVGTIKDITERKKAEELLVRERNLLRTLIDNLPDKVHLKDTELRYQLNNTVHLRTLGLSGQEESIGKSILDFYPLSSMQSYVDEEQKIIKSGIPKLEYEEQFIDKEKNELQWYLTTKVPVRDHLNIIGGLLTISRNITDRKKTEEALRESEQKFRTLFENMTEGVALHEMIYDGDKAIDYRIIDINPAYEKHTGLAQTHARGLLASKLYGTGTPPYLDEWAGVALTGTPYSFETFFAPLNRHFHISVISPGKGYFATVFEDITDRKRKEQDLREKNSELERFTYTVSHDLKSPLITIKGFSGGLLKDISLGRHDRLESDLKRINDAADKMSGLLNDLLELSRIGRIVNPPSDIAFDTLVHEVVLLLSGSISKSKANVIVQEGLPVVRADRRRLFEVIQNLVENALKFTGDQSDPQVEIGMRNDGAEQVFFVRDNGKGIDPRYHETIFGLFNKLDASTEGTGIGLALARRIIEVHGGKIWVESEGTNRGATFYFTLSAIQPQHP